MKLLPTTLALFQLGGGEIILILVLLLVLVVIVVAVIGVVYVIVRAIQRPPRPPAPTLPPEAQAETERRRNLEHLSVLSIFHFVFAGLALVGVGFLCVHYAIMHSFMTNPEMWKSQKGPGPPPKEFFDMFVWFYVFMGALLLLGLVLNVLSGLFLRQRRHRIFSLVIAGLNCLQIPFGTALGVFTILVLSRPSVCQLYSGGEEPTA